MPNVVIDLFNDADATNLTAHRLDWGNVWEQYTGAWTIQSNKARSPNGAESMIVTESCIAHGLAHVNTTIPSGNDSATGVVIRMADALNGWDVRVQRDGGGTPYLGINEVTGGSIVNRGVINAPTVAGAATVIYGYFIGNTITGFLPNTGETIEYASATANNAVTKHGLYGYGGAFGYATGDYDDFYVSVIEYPSVLTVATSGVDSNGATHAVTMPANIVAGELLLVVSAFDGNPTISVETGASGLRWNKLGQASNGTACTGSVFWKIAEGSDALTLTIGAASEQSSSVAYRIFNGNFVSGTSANGSSADSNPPDFVPTNGSKDYLFIATRSGDAQVQATVPPTGYGAPGAGTLRTRTAGTSTGASVATCEKSVTAASDDPGTFTSATEQWVSWTLAVENVRPSREFNVSHAVTRAVSF